MDNDDEVNKNKKFITSGLHETRQKQQPFTENVSSRRQLTFKLLALIHLSRMEEL